MNEQKESIPSSAAENSMESILSTAQERSKELLDRQPEKNETKHDNKAELAAERSNVESLFAAEKSAGEKKKAHLDSGSTTYRPASKSDKNKSYKKTLDHMQEHLSIGEKTFSKFIHNPVVEKPSELVGSTVARPNAILAGSFVAFISVMTIYVIARNMGYTLSGFETIGAFIFGWSLGLIFEYARAAFSGKAL